MKILIIGHICLDKRDGEWVLGGPPSYQIPIFQLFDTQITLLTSYNPMEINLHKIYPEIEIINNQSKVTTKYRYSRPDKSSLDDRKLILISKACDLDVSSLIEDRRFFDIVMISPIAGELSKNQIEKTRNLGTTIVFDIQGLVRKFSTDGTVYYKTTIEELSWLQRICTIIKISTGEYDNALQIINQFPSLLIITDSGKTIKLSSNGIEEIISVDKQENIQDATGSGDIFLASFSILVTEYPVKKATLLAHELTKTNLNRKRVPDLKILKSEWEKIFRNSGNSQWKQNQI